MQRPINATHVYEPWLISAKAGKGLTAKLRAFYADGEDPFETYDDQTENGYEPYMLDESGIAVIPLAGVMCKFPSLFQALFGGVSTSDIRDTLIKLASDPAVKGVMFYIDSPGGEVGGTEALAEAVKTVRAAGKPVWAYGADTLCSAAYWIASQCERVGVNATCSVGSIGTVSLLADSSKFYESLGVTFTAVGSGKFKGLGFEGLPITPEQIAEVQREIDALNNVFIAAVEQGRGMTLTDEIKTARVFIGAEAVAQKLVDEINTWEGFFGEMKKLLVMDNPTPTVTPTPVPAASTAATVEVVSDPVKTAEVIDPVTLESPIDKLDRMEALMSAFPENAGYAMEAFKSGHDVPKARSVLTEREKEQTEKQAKTKEEAAKVGVQPVGAMMNAVDAPADHRSSIELAESRWENDESIRREFPKKSQYVAVVKYRQRYGLNN